MGFQRALAGLFRPYCGPFCNYFKKTIDKYPGIGYIIIEQYSSFKQEVVMLMIGLSGLAICMLVLVFLGLLINIFKVFLDMKSRDKISKVVLKLFDNHIKIKVFSMILGFFLVILGGTLKNVGIILLGASIMGITIMMIAAPD